MPDRICSIADCDAPVDAAGFCSSHYSRLRRHGDPLAGSTFRRRKGTVNCIGPECDKAAKARGMCSGHWAQWNRGLSLSPLRIQHKFIDGQKKCTGCDLTLPVGAFHKHGEHRSYLCRSCVGVLNRAKTYGLTLAQVRKFMERPCEGCGRRVNGKKLHIDHCHQTGMVRGVLCDSCNLALGRVRDDPRVLRNLADYLERTHRMTQPRTIHEAATEHAMSIEDFAETDAYKAGVADGSIVAWVRTGGTPESEPSETTAAPEPKAKKADK